MAPGLRRWLASGAMLIGAVGAMVRLATYSDEEVSPQSVPPHAAADASWPKPRPLASFDRFVAITDRPLFSPTRRPRPVRPPEAPQPTGPRRDPEPPPLEAVLAGILISPEGNSAILRLDEGRSAIVRQGGVLKGWTLKAVSSDRVVFSLAGSETEVVFRPHQTRTAEAADAAAPMLAPIRRRR